VGRKQKTTTFINRQRILNATARLIKEKGVSRISLADIAAAVKISKGTLYYYYPSKSDLIFDIAEESMNQMTQKILRWVEKSRDGTAPEDILKIVFDAILRARSRAQVHLYLILEALNDDALRRRFCDEYRQWLTMIRRGLDRLLPAEKDTALLAQIILAAIYGLLLRSFIEVPKEGPKPPLEEISRFFVSASSAAGKRAEGRADKRGGAGADEHNPL
jgi:AcrR family transcriptional regulator